MFQISIILDVELRYQETVIVLIYDGDCKDVLDAAIVAALISTHAKVHDTAVTPAKAVKVKRPTVSSAGTSEEWTYFLSRWKITSTRQKSKTKNS